MTEYVGLNISRELLEQNRFAAKVVILRNKENPEVLLFEHASGYLLLPGGQIELRDYDDLYGAWEDSPTFDEVASIALQRELVEEAGNDFLAGLIDYWHPTYGTYWYNKNTPAKPCFDFSGVIWWEEKQDPPLKLEDEIIGYRWLPLNELQKYDDEVSDGNFHMPRNIWQLIDMAYKGEQGESLYTYYDID